MVLRSGFKPTHHHPANLTYAVSNFFDGNKKTTRMSKQPLQFSLSMWKIISSVSWKDGKEHGRSLLVFARGSRSLEKAACLLSQLHHTHSYLRKIIASPHPNSSASALTASLSPFLVLSLTARYLTLHCLVILNRKLSFLKNKSLATSRIEQTTGTRHSATQPSSSQELVVLKEHTHNTVYDGYPCPSQRDSPRRTLNHQLCNGRQIPQKH